MTNDQSKLTSKASKRIVLEKYPGAVADWGGLNDWRLLEAHYGCHEPLCWGSSEDEVWINAAARIQAETEKAAPSS